MTSEVPTEKHARPILGYRLEAEENTARRIFLKALRSFARRNRVNSRRYQRSGDREQVWLLSSFKNEGPARRQRCRATAGDLGSRQWARGANIRQQGVLLDTPCRFISAPGRNRTGDLALRRHSLYPLSYRGRKERPETDNRPLGWWRRRGSNPRPSHCERDALPTELLPRKGRRILAAKLRSAKVSRIITPRRNGPC